MRFRSCLTLDALEPRDLPSASFETAPIYPNGDLAVLDHARAIAVLGQALGRRNDVFLKIGDSNTEFEPFGENGYLRPLGEPGSNPLASGLAALGQNILDTWSTFRHSINGGGNSFTRNDLTAVPGYQVPSVLPNLDGEIAATNAGIALIMLGTNDATVNTPSDAFRSNLESLLIRLERAGVVPLLSTIPDSAFNGGAYTGRVHTFNQVIADVAFAEHIPLWNLFRQESSLPAAGLDSGGVHLSQSPSGGGNFSSFDLLFGQNTHNLGALYILDWYREQVAGGSPQSIPTLPNWTSLAGHTVYAVGRDLGQAPSVSIFDAVTHVELDRFNAFDPSFAGGVRVAVADVNGDGIVDIVVGAGPGGGPAIGVFSGADGSRLASFFAFEPSFRDGVSSVVAKDLDGDGEAEIAVGAGAGGGPVIAIYHGGDFAESQRFFAFDPAFRGGVNVALGSFEGLGPTILAGAGVGGGPQVSLFQFGFPIATKPYFADDPGYYGGVVLAAGDLNGDGFDELATGRADSGSQVAIRDPMTWTLLRSISTATESNLAGIHLAMISRPGGTDELLVASGLGGSVQVEGFESWNGSVVQLPPNDSQRAYGIFVG